MAEEKKVEKKVEKATHALHTEGVIKEVKESTMAFRNEAVAGIQVGKKPKFKAH